MRISTVTILSLSAAVLLGASCSHGATGPAVGANAAASITIVGPSTHCCAAAVGVEIPLSAVVLNAAGDTLHGIPVEWNSSDTDRVGVNTSGMVITKASGTAFVFVDVVRSQPQISDSIEVDVEPLVSSTVALPQQRP